jgi:hypothetical protein
MTHPGRRHPAVAGMTGRCVDAAGPRSQGSAMRAGRRSDDGGRNTPVPARPDPLGANDFALMAVLGIVHDEFSTFREIVPAAKSLAGADWQPTADVLAGALEIALSTGLLTSTERGHALTEQGHLHLATLVQAPPTAARGGTARTAAALKVCFLGVLDLEARDLVIDELIRLQEQELHTLLDSCARCPAASICSRLWMAREVERLRGEIAWLSLLKADLEPAS